ncbi:acetate CoA-transferase, subunit A [Alkalihalophilus pseudofirmus OF4]|uniref:Acetate CoA-transferase, subunit A n=1 Tax=Alkalihalophilus pseudofirmus (strain ATCC BAA-2126 / JCM 17055 / OF4) TaxID=398511 RepID=D3FSC6_ALKPO|nr:CoA transferase subunit A [Alkalihalophilus pseudofirmus]ADC51761.1 acetate CoA-transferase, subunit A [Alkalihalophilus pseudofirmus OF4]OLS36964.1 acyl CoA:acetate/3-ketoacid CoA transferase subunit alpha [Alkalihalophilus pseudofirmus]WEG15346.1 CoA transferase subunit A [Alkalihalophilus pseudofirmus]
MEAKRSLNKIGTLSDALSVIHDGSTVMFGGFGGIGNPPTIIRGMLEKGVKDLTLIGNDSAFPHIGIGQIIKNKQAKKLIASHIGSNPVAGQLMTEGELEVEFSPQGTLAERIRAGGVGIPAFLTDVGLGSMIEEGKEKVTLNNKEYLLETALTADVSIVYAKKADTFGNLIYETSARNTNPLVAMAGTFTIAEVEEIVEPGELAPEEITTPGIFVDLIIKTEGVDWKWVWE